MPSSSNSCFFPNFLKLLISSSPSSPRKRNPDRNLHSFGKLFTYQSLIQWLIQVHQLTRFLPGWRKMMWRTPDFAIAIWGLCLSRKEHWRIHVGGFMFMQTILDRWVFIPFRSLHLHDIYWHVLYNFYNITCAL